jgi:hypothetical protein
MHTHDIHTTCIHTQHTERETSRETYIYERGRGGRVEGGEEGLREGTNRTGAMETSDED